MKCPHCGKEVKDDALFCGFCGKQVPQMPLTEASPPSPPDEEKIETPIKVDNIPVDDAEEAQKMKAENKPRKKHTALKVLIVFVLLSFIGGSTLGFLTARGIVSIKALLPTGSFKWTSFSEGQTEKADVDDTTEGKDDEKGEDTDSTLPTDGETESQPSVETTVPEETQQPSENDAHYAKYIGDSIVVIDDKAHIWEESVIAGILEKAKAMSESSGYSIMIVVTNDMFDMTSQEFADDYYDYVLASNEGNTELVADGYLFLINLADREYYLSTSGKAIEHYTDTRMTELFNEIQQFMADGNYEAAVNTLIEKTIY